MSYFHQIAFLWVESVIIVYSGVPKFQIMRYHFFERVLLCKRTSKCKLHQAFSYQRLYSKKLLVMLCIIEIVAVIQLRSTTRVKHYYTITTDIKILSNIEAKLYNYGKGTNLTETFPVFYCPTACSNFYYNKTSIWFKFKKPQWLVNT